MSTTVNENGIVEPVVEQAPVMSDEFTLVDLKVLHLALSKLEIKGADWRAVGSVLVKLEKKLETAILADKLAQVKA